MKRLLIAAVATMLMVSGCSDGTITVSKVQHSFATSFLNLYARQQTLLGRAGIDPATTYGTASCVKGSPTGPQRGAGDDWSCVEQWRDYRGVLDLATYEVQVQTDDCLTAIGPTSVVGQPMMDAPDGRIIVNPLYEFYACFS